MHLAAPLERKGRELMPLVFGYASHASSRATKNGMQEFLGLVGQAARIGVVPKEHRTYPELAAALDRGDLDLAWLPPISFILLHKRGKVVPLVSHHRGGRAEFHSVLLVRADSKIRTPAGLQGTRAAWVDKHSASGYVLPRISLAAMGVDPRTAFASQRFFESHDAVVRAVVGAKADVGATYARLDRTGAPARGAWMDLPGAEGAVRVLSTFGAIPSDVIGVRADLDGVTQSVLRKAFIDTAYDVRGALLVRDLLGVDEFRPWEDSGYSTLRRAMIRAAADGLFEADM
jgi:phosphate/phosphite/phosphonate ABC transporter binding protein